MIDLDRFSRPKEVIIPVVNGKGKSQGRQLTFYMDNGWYKVKIGDEVELLGKATQMDVERVLNRKKKLRGLAMGDQFFPTNFSNLEILGEGLTVNVWFQKGEAWDVIKVVLWEDGNFYYAGIDYGYKRDVIQQIKRAYEGEKSIKEIKGVTPELRYYYLILSLQRDTARKMVELQKMRLAEADKLRALEEFRKTFEGRLEKTIEDAGGKLVRFTKQSGKKLLVVWKVGRNTLKTIINEDMQVVSLGYCASGEDKKHTMGSAISLAKVYLKEGGVGDGGLYVTRD